MPTALSAGVAWILVQAHVSNRKQDCLQLGCLWGPEALPLSGPVQQLWGLLGPGEVTRPLRFSELESWLGQGPGSCISAVPTNWQWPQGHSWSPGPTLPSSATSRGLSVGGVGGPVAVTAEVWVVSWALFGH